MLRVVRDEHHGHVGEFRMSPDRAEHLDAVGVVFVELAVDEDQVEAAVAEQGQRIIAGGGLLDFNAVEIGGEEAADRGVIRSALADVEHSLGHAHPFSTG